MVKRKYSGNGSGDVSVKRKGQFDFRDDQYSLDSATYQKIFSNVFVTQHPVSKLDDQPKQIDFECKSQNIWSGNPINRFRIVGAFQKKPLETDVDWKAIELEDYANVIVMPNWLEGLIRRFDVFSGTQMLKFREEDQYMACWLNSWIYNFMSKRQKKNLCMMPANTGYSVPSKVNGWNATANNEWHVYSAHIFGAKFTTDWIPIHTPPFYQNSNYFLNGQIQNIFPVPLLDKLSFRITFHDHYDYIFKKTTPASKVQYRVMFEKFEIITEELKLNKNFQNDFFKPRLLHYPGVTRHLRVETVPNTSASWRSKFPDVPFPEGIFIFGLPKNIPVGTYKHQDNADYQVYSANNVSNVMFTFGEKKFFVDEPNIYSVNNDLIEWKAYFDQMFGATPFGLDMDCDKISVANHGGKNTPYPFVFVSLCNFAEKTRLIPPENDGSIMLKNEDLDMTLTFSGGGSTRDTAYAVYIYWTTNNLVYDMNKKHFFNPYLKNVS